MIYYINNENSIIYFFQGSEKLVTSCWIYIVVFEKIENICNMSTFPLNLLIWIVGSMKFRLLICQKLWLENSLAPYKISFQIRT